MITGKFINLPTPKKLNDAGGLRKKEKYAGFKVPFGT